MKKLLAWLTAKLPSFGALKAAGAAEYRHATELASVKAEHSSELSRLAEHHGAELARLKDEHSQELRLFRSGTELPLSSLTPGDVEVLRFLAFKVEEAKDIAAGAGTTVPQVEYHLARLKMASLALDLSACGPWFIRDAGRHFLGDNGLLKSPPRGIATEAVRAELLPPPSFPAIAPPS